MIGFIADFFNIVGGAEKNDSVLLDSLKKKFKVCEIQSHLCKVSDIDRFDFIIVGNFVNLSEEVKSYISKNKNYLIYEHDHKYVENRDPSKYKNFKIPKEYLINVDFYKNAKMVICLSNIQVKILEDSVELNNAVSIGTSLWSKETLGYIKSLNNCEKIPIAAIMDSNNPIKNKIKSINFCKENKIPYELVSSSDYREFLKNLSKYDKLVFFPGVLESLSRLFVEAKMLNCKVITIPKMLGASYESWAKLSGNELIQVIENQVENALHLFERCVENWQKK